MRTSEWIPTWVFQVPVTMFLATVGLTAFLLPGVTIVNRYAGLPVPYGFVEEFTVVLSIVLSSLFSAEYLSLRSLAKGTLALWSVAIVVLVVGQIVIFALEMPLRGFADDARAITWMTAYGLAIALTTHWSDV